MDRRLSETEGEQWSCAQFLEAFDRPTIHWGHGDCECWTRRT